jgi:Flp pilus assembly protein, protease CpaA
MWGGYISYVLLAALATALLVAAFTDLRRREIDNWLNAGIAMAAPLWWVSIGFGWLDIAFQIGLCLLTFAIACVFFAARQMGGGDVKLLAALALWFTPVSFMQVVTLMAVIGGGASVALAAFNMKRIPGQIFRDGVALGSVLIWLAATSMMAIALAMHRPIIGEQAIGVFSSLLPSTIAVIAAVVAVFAILAQGLSHVVRRQKRRLPVPYGIAIAAAGLWVLGDQTLPAAHIAAGTL